MDPRDLSHLAALDLRFAETPPPPSRFGGNALRDGITYTFGMVGLVTDDGEAIPFHAVQAGGRFGTEAKAAGRAVPSAVAWLHQLACTHAASLADVPAAAAALMEVMRADVRDNGYDSDFHWQVEDEDWPANVERAVQQALRRVDTFQVTRSVCRDLQVQGDLRFFRALEPACEAVLRRAREPGTVADAARAQAAKMERQAPGFAARAATWRDAVDVAAAQPAP